MAEPKLEVLDDSEALARRAATFVAERARAAVTERNGLFTLAVSGGRTPWAMFADLEEEMNMPWDRVVIYQVDERVGPRGDPDRNLAGFEANLPHVTVHAMPVEEDDLEAAAARYAADLPERFDLIHLGLGPDGHTASLVPGDPVLDLTDRDVALTREYNGRRRMTLTYPVLDRAREVMWLVAGADKAEPLRRMRAGDRSIPAGRVRAESQVIFADRAAAG